MDDLRIRRLILPGWQGSGPDHWQRRWERLHGDRVVEQADWTWPRRGDWMARLEEVIRDGTGPAILVAHSLGCHLVAEWSAASSSTAQVRGALLVAVPDVERSDAPPQLAGWRPMRRERLPFPSVAVLSSDDPYARIDRARKLALQWGSRIEEAGPMGHLNAESGLGDWPQGRAWLAEFGPATGER